MNISNSFSSIEQVTGQYLNQKSATVSSPSVSNFEDVLKKKAQIAENSKSDTDSLKFSKHAGERLADRNISLTDEQLSRLEEGTKKAEKKGINESLVLLDNMAFIVNIKNNTVVTAMNQQESTEQIYTNIDGAVII